MIRWLKGEGMLPEDGGNVSRVAAIGRSYDIPCICCRNDEGKCQTTPFGRTTVKD
ncbi:MAG: hypothetical protein ACOX86_06255 [Pelotomaculaceae bacterium]